MHVPRFRESSRVSLSKTQSGLIPRKKVKSTEGQREREIIQKYRSQTLFVYKLRIDCCAEDGCYFGLSVSINLVVPAREMAAAKDARKSE